MRTYKIYAALTSTTNNAANVQIVRNGRIRAVRWALGISAPANAAAVYAEVSIQPVSQIAVNNSQGSIDQVSHVSNLTTSGGVPGALNVQRDLDFPIGAGETLYLNATVAGTVTASTTIFIDVEEGKA